MGNTALERGHMGEKESGSVYYANFMSRIYFTLGDEAKTEDLLLRCTEGIDVGTHDDGGTLWISVLAQTGTPDRDLATLDLATGIITNVGSTVDSLSALAWGNAVPTKPVPTLDIRALQYWEREPVARSGTGVVGRSH